MKSRIPATLVGMLACTARRERPDGANQPSTMCGTSGARRRTTSGPSLRAVAARARHRSPRLTLSETPRRRVPRSAAENPFSSSHTWTWSLSRASPGRRHRSSRPRKTGSFRRGSEGVRHRSTPRNAGRATPGALGPRPRRAAAVALDPRVLSLRTRRRSRGRPLIVFPPERLPSRGSSTRGRKYLIRRRWLRSSSG